LRRQSGDCRRLMAGLGVATIAGLAPARETMQRRSSRPACALAATLSLLAVAAPVLADGSCQSPIGELGPASVEGGTLDSPGESDWYDLFAGAALVVLQPGVDSSQLHVHDPANMDADLYIWNIPCKAVLCSSIAAGGGTDKCLAQTSDPLSLKWRMHVEVRWYSAGPNDHIPYTLSVTELVS
jgi:hypothetical protein